MIKKKRLIAAIIIKDEKVYQSYGFKNYLPIGSLQIIIENLNRWFVDEIMIIDIGKSIEKREPDYKLLNRISKDLSTPLIYAGGIKTSKEAVRVIEAGADRIMLTSLILDNSSEIHKIASKIGQQAIILGYPFLIKKKKVFFFDYINKNNLLIEPQAFSNLEESYSEIMFIDVLNDGLSGKFNLNILKYDITKKDIILFGGLDYKLINKSKKNRSVGAFAIGNQMFFKEHAYQKIKLKIENKFFSRELYEKKN